MQNAAAKQPIHSREENVRHVDDRRRAHLGIPIFYIADANGREPGWAAVDLGLSLPSFKQVLMTIQFFTILEIRCLCFCFIVTPKKDKTVTMTIRMDRALPEEYNGLPVKTNRSGNERIRMVLRYALDHNGAYREMGETSMFILFSYL